MDDDYWRSERSGLEVWSLGIVLLFYGVLLLICVDRLCLFGVEDYQIAIFARNLIDRYKTLNPTRS